MTLADNVVTLTATAKDGDIDTASFTDNVGDRFTFKDDAPAITVNDATGTYDAGAQGTWTDSNGADGFKSLSVTLDSFKIGSTTTDPNPNISRNPDSARWSRQLCLHRIDHRRLHR